MIKNNYEELNVEQRNQISSAEFEINRLKIEIKEKDQTIENISMELELIRKKYNLCEQEC